MDAGPPLWDPEAKTFSFFLHKRGRESVLCIVAMDALENAKAHPAVPGRSICSMRVPCAGDQRRAGGTLGG